jgi:hypothetical protein
MRMIRPQLAAPQVTIAEDQVEFKPITAALVVHPSYPARASAHGPVNSVVVAFRPDADERRRLAAGEDLYVSLLTHGGPMQGIICAVGPETPAAWFNVAVEP